jgi:putative ABC transport system permease protein
MLGRAGRLKESASMNVREAVIIAAHSMRTARLRTLLTAMGIVLGVAAVIVLVGLGGGMRSGFNDKFGALSTSIVVSKTNQAQQGGNSVKSLTESDITALTRPGAAPHIAAVTPLRNGAALISVGDKDFKASVAGATSTYLRVRNRSIMAGSMFTDQDNQDRARVVVLGTKVVQYLFNGDVVAALNSNVRIGRLTMRVVGVLAPGGDDLDGVGVMPLDSSRALFAGGQNLNGIGVLATDVNSVPAATQEVNQILDAQHGITDPGQRDYNTTAMVAQLDQINKFVDLLLLFTVSVAGVALFVGALGIANIMLVTVTERTSEIGIRKAIGARSGAIMKQFLVESMAVSGVGGVGGVVLGIVLVLAGRQLVPRIQPDLGLPELSVTGIAVAFGVSLVIGLLAGSYPARRASRLHPIDALRY